MGVKEYDYTAVISTCSTAFIANALMNKVFLSDGKVVTIIRRCLSTKSVETIRSFWSLGLDKGTVEWVVSKVIGEVSNKEINDVINEQYKNGKKK